MSKRWEVTWEGELPAPPQAVWDTITKHADGYLWPIEYEPRVGGAERGLTQGGGVVTEWEPHRRFATRTRPEQERDGLNELIYELESLGGVTYLRVAHHAEIPEEEYDAQLAMCRAHTTFYMHSLGIHACFFAGQGAEYASADVEGSFAEVLRRIGVPEDAVRGDRVTITPEGGGAPLHGVIDYLSATMCGIRGADVLYRVYGRDTWGWPVGVTSHRFATNGSEA